MKQRILLLTVIVGVLLLGIFFFLFRIEGGSPSVPAVRAPELNIIPIEGSSGIPANIPKAGVEGVQSSP